MKTFQSMSMNVMLFFQGKNKIELTGFSGGIDLKILAENMGYNPQNHHHYFYETSNRNCLNKMVFEVGHTLGEYKYLEQYANYY